MPAMTILGFAAVPEFIGKPGAAEPWRCAGRLGGGWPVNANVAPNLLARLCFRPTRHGKRTVSIGIFVFPIPQNNMDIRVGVRYAYPNLPSVLWANDFK